MTKPTDDLIRKRSATERMIIAKTLLETVLQDMPTAEPELANNSPKVENGNGDLISRWAAIEALKAMAVPLYEDPVCEDIWERDRTLDNAIDAIRGLPTAEPRKGKWIVHDWTGLIVCDQCGFDAPMSTITGQQYGSEYCQTCGAKMEESE